MLSHYDREQLKKIEEWFEDSEPALVKEFEKIGEGRPARRWRRLLLALDVSTGLVLALSLLTGSASLVLIGMVMMLAAMGGHMAHHFPSPV